MDDQRLGIAAIVGGASLALWIAFIVLNPTGGYVSYLDPIWILWNLGIALGVIGLYRGLVVSRPRLSKLGAGIAIVGATLSIMEPVVSWLIGLDRAVIPSVLQDVGFFLAVFGFLGLLLGSFILGIIAAVDGPVSPRLAGVLVVGSILATGMDDTNIRILLLLPFAIAWVLIGYDMWTTSAGKQNVPESSR